MDSETLRVHLSEEDFMSLDDDFVESIIGTAAADGEGLVVSIDIPMEEETLP